MSFVEHKPYIKELILGLHENDSNWDWKLKKLLPHKIYIRWSYLDYCGEVKNSFIIIYEPMADTLACYSPHEELIDIADSIEEAIITIGHYAHSRY